MASPSSPNADSLNSTELRGTLGSAGKTTRGGAQHPAVQARLQDLAPKLRAMLAALEKLKSLPTKPSPPGYGPYGVPFEAVEPLRRLHKQLSRLVRYFGDHPLNMVDGVDTLVSDADTEADLRGRVEALIPSVNPKEPFSAVLKKEREDAEAGGDGEIEAQQGKQSAGDLASKGKDRTHVRMEEPWICISWLTRSHLLGAAV